MSLPTPDLTLFLDIPPEVVKGRGGYGEERHEKEEMQQKVREMFQRIGWEMVFDTDVDSQWVTVDAIRER